MSFGRPAALLDAVTAALDNTAASLRLAHGSGVDAAGLLLRNAALEALIGAYPRGFNLPERRFRTAGALLSIFPSQVYYTGTVLSEPFLRFGSWMGGDRDGNPYVTAQTTEATLLLQADTILQRYGDELADLMGSLSQSRRRLAMPKLPCAF